jgi:pimeloyl-ACP methyl ester carboxylesterase
VAFSRVFFTILAGCLLLVDSALKPAWSSVRPHLEPGGAPPSASGSLLRVAENGTPAPTEPAHARALLETESPSGMHALNSYDPKDAKRKTICLVHGLNSSAEVFVHWIEPLEKAGFGLVVYEYPYNRDLESTAAEFGEDLRRFRTEWNDQRPWAIVTHSMGGLVAREYVEGPTFTRDISELLLIAPPNRGSAIAGAQAVIQLLKVANSVGKGRVSLRSLTENGLGEAASDLAPGSAFLARLNARPRREGVKYAILAGDVGLLRANHRPAIEARLKLLERALRNGRTSEAALTRVLDVMTDGLGDGCVPIDSTRLDGVTDHATLHADHLELIRAPLAFPDPGPIIALPWVLERLAAASK